MKQGKILFIAVILLILATSLFRFLGFAPQIALAIFSGTVIGDRRLAVIVPLVSMFLSDVLFETFYRFGFAPYGGFYNGQITNYLLLAAITFIGFAARNKKPGRIIMATLAGPTIFFLLSNLLLWIDGTGGYQRPKTFSGLIMVYMDGIPFFRTGMFNAIFFSCFLFGSYYLIKYFISRKKELA